MLTRDDIEARRYSIVQVFYWSPWRVDWLLVPTRSQPEADEMAARWLDKHRPGYRAFCCYPGNYIRQARVLWAEGKFACWDEPGEDNALAQALGI